MKKALLLLVTLFLFFFAKSQSYDNPIASKQSHPELKIERIEITENNTIISLKVTNKRDAGGWFCASRDINLKSSKGNESYPLIKTENIPACPDQHKFSSIGETLSFKLYFSPIDQDIKFVDLIENCTNACFSFYGIILDNQHNQKIRAFENGFELYQNQKYVEAIPLFEKVLKGDISIDSHIYGLSYYYLIIIYQDLRNIDKMNQWYEELLNSNLEEKKTFIKELEKEGIIKKSSSKN